MAITTLIDKQDNFEIVRDQIAAILAAETLSQQALATAASKDPDLWKFNVYTERSNPYEAYTSAGGDKSPIVSVWWDSDQIDGGAGNLSSKQQTIGLFNVDCFGYAESTSDGAGGQLAGDEYAAKAAQRCVRLVRNILMAPQYQYLEMRRVVGYRRPQSKRAYHQERDRGVEQISAIRFVLEVSFNEFSPQQSLETLEILAFTMKRAEDGKIIFETEFDYT